MDRSLVQMKRSRSRTANSSGIGTTVKKPTIQPRTGIVVDLLHTQIIMADAGGRGARETKHSRAVCIARPSQLSRRAVPMTVPMELVCTRRMLPAADVTRNRPQQRPFVNQALNTHARQGVQ
jgi:hypothetical protein